MTTTEVRKISIVFIILLFAAGGRGFGFFGFRAATFIEQRPDVFAAGQLPKFFTVAFENRPGLHAILETFEVGLQFR